MSGFFAPQMAFAAHTTTVTVSPTLVKGSQTSTYTFGITNNGANSVYRAEITAIPAGFSINTGSVSCPTDWNSIPSTSALGVCTANDPFSGAVITSGNSFQVSFSATSANPGSDNPYIWSVLTKDTNAGATNTNTQASTLVDVTAPTITTITTKDANSDGSVETATIIFSEAVNDSTFAASNFTIGGVTATTINTGTANDNTFNVVLATGVAGTAAKQVHYTQGTGADIAGNLLANVVDGTVVETDGANPILLSAQTKTTTTIDLTFSEDLKGSTVNLTGTDFTIGGGFSITHAVEGPDDGTVVLTITPAMGTGVTPTVSYVGMVEDLASNIAPHAGPITPADGVAPIISSTQTISTTQILVTFSEAMSAVVGTDFTVAGNTISSVSFTPGASTATFTLGTPIGTGATPLVSTITSPTGTRDNSSAINLITGSLSSTPTDGIAPTLVITATSATSPTNTSPIAMTVTFSESVTGLAIGEIMVVNGTAANLLGSGANYTFDITSPGQGTVTVNIAGGVAQDAASNNNTVATQFSIVFDSLAPTTPTVLTPNGGEFIKGGSSYNITWTPTSDTNLGATPIKIEYSALGDFSDTLMLANNETNDGTYTWNPVPSVNLATAKIRITATDLAGNSSNDASNNAFTIDSMAPTTPTVLTPNGGEFIKGGSPYNITWTLTTDTNLSVNPITIEYAANGTTFVSVATGVANNGTYAWAVPSDNVATAKIRITATDLAGNTSNDVSNNAFTVDSIAPTVNAGTDAIKNTLFTQDATASDGGSGIATYVWTRTSGPGIITFGTAGAEDTTITASADGTHVIRLTVTDNAGNVTSDEMTLVWDTVAPTLNIVLANSALKVGETSLVTFTFSEAVTGFENADVTTIDNGTLTPVASGDGGITWTATFTPTTGITGLTNVITVNKTGVMDTAGNAGVGMTSSANYTIDTLRPTVSAVLTDSALIAGETSLVTFTFSEAPTGFDAADVIVVGSGSIGVVSTTGNPLVFTAILTPTPNIEVPINILTVGTGWTDLAGNAPAGTTNSANYTVETLKPSVTLASLTANPTNGLIAVTAEFSETVTGFDATDITVGNGVVENFIALNGHSYTFNVNPTDGASVAVTIQVLADKAMDVAGNNNTVSNQLAYTSDTVAPAAPVVTLFDPINDSNKTSVTITGTGEANASINYSIDDTNGLTAAITGTSTVSAGGVINITGINVSTLDDGTLTATVTVADAAGNVSANGMDTATKDTSAPSAPSTPDLTTDSGSSSTDDITKNNTPTFAGTAEANATVKIYDGAIQVGSGIATGGSYSITVSTLTDGVHNSITAKATDAAGNVSSASGALSVTIDTAMPTAVFSAATDNVGSVTGALVSGATTDDTSLTLSGTNQSGSTVEVFNGASSLGQATITGTTWSYEATVANGTTYQFNVKETDVAGNTSSATSNFTVIGDTSAPSAPSVPDMTAATDSGSSPTDNITNDNTPTFIGTAEPNATVKMYDGATEVGSGTATLGSYSITVSTLTEGVHSSITAKATDAAGNVSSASSALSVTIDTAMPAIPVISSIAGDNSINNAEKAAIHVVGTAEADSMVNVSLTNGATVVGSGIATGGNFDITIDGTTLNDGTVTPSATATDAAGNVSAAVATPLASKDTVAPTVTGKTPDANVVGVAPSTNITVTFEDDVTIAGANVTINPGNLAKTVTFNSGDNVATINPTADLSNNTTYTITLTGVTDTAGNTLPTTSWSFTTAASYSIDLTTGWNLVSLPVVPSTTTASTVLGALDNIATIQSVFTYDALTGTWLVYHPNSPETSTFSTMDTGTGYWIDYLAVSPATISGTGNLFLEGANTPPQKTLAAGWNLIGYYQLENTTNVAANAALSTITGQWTQLRTYNNTSKQFQSVLGTNNMSPGQGYWIFMKSSTIGTYVYGPGDAS